MRELPILFNGDMVRAILDGRKTQTRRPLRNQPKHIRESVFHASGIEDWHGYEIKLPYAVGDRMYVRETWSTSTRGWIYKADGHDLSRALSLRWRPSIHMPKRAARIWLTVTGVRVERLQDISEEDCRAEGVQYWPEHLSWGPSYMQPSGWDAVSAFAFLWDAQYGKTRYAWANNPWVSVTEFQRARD